MIIAPPSFSFKGDKNKAMSLKSQALQLYDFTVRAARLGGVNSVARSFTLSDGSIISFHSSKQSNYNNQLGKITIFSPFTSEVTIDTASEIYMESGLVSYTATGCGALNNSYRPWQFRVLDSTGPQGTFSSSDFSFSGILQGLESIAFGCKIEEQVDEISAVPCGEGAEPITIKEGGYCTTSLLPKKKNFLKVRPSVFSGLTRRYIQALYGSNKYDLEVDSAFFFIPHVKVPRYISSSTRQRWDEEAAAAAAQGIAYKTPSDKVVIYADYPSCQFISRTKDYYYFFVSIRENQFLDIYPMVFGDSGKVILEKLRSNDFAQNPQHLESYALSDAMPDTDTLLGTLSIGSGTVTGEPLAFTWNANSTGSKLTLVTHSEITSEKMYASREYEITLQITRSDTPSTLEYDSVFFTAGVGLSQVSPDSKWNPRLDTVWGQNYVYNMQIWWSGSWFSAGTTLSDPLCPMYSYYDYSDVKRIVTLESSVSTISGSSGIVFGPQGCGPGITATMRDSFTQFGGVSGTKRIGDLEGIVNPSRNYVQTTITAGDPYVVNYISGPVFGSVETGGCSGVGGFSWGIYTNPSAFTCSLSRPMSVAEGVPSNFCTPISSTPDGWGVFNAAVQWYSIAPETASTVTGEIKSAKALVLIPFGDCCSIVYGMKKGVFYAKKQDNTIGGWAVTQTGYVLSRARISPVTEFEIIGTPTPTLLSGWASSSMNLGFSRGWQVDVANILGLNGSVSLPDNTTIGNYTILMEVQDTTTSIITNTDNPNWLDSLLNPSPFDLFHLMQPSANCTSDLHGNYYSTMVTDQVLTFKKGFKDEEIGAIGWQ